MLANRRTWVLGLAAALPLAGFIGLRPALAENTPPCGAVTVKPGCETGGVLFGGVYQVPYELTDGTSITVTCAGGPSPASRDSALRDNFTYYLDLAGIAVDEVTDSKGRLVGYSFQVPAGTLTGLTLRQYLTCIDDH